MPVYLDANQSHGAPVARAVQPVEQPIGARRGEQRGQAHGVVARFLRVLFGHGRYRAAAPARTSTNIGGETLGEGGRR